MRKEILIIVCIAAIIVLAIFIISKQNEMETEIRDVKKSLAFSNSSSNQITLAINNLIINPTDNTFNGPISGNGNSFGDNCSIKNNLG